MTSGAARGIAHGREDDDGIGPWHDLLLALKLAPHRAREAYEGVLARLAGDPAAVAELRESSALAQLAGERAAPASGRDGAASLGP